MSDPAGTAPERCLGGVVRPQERGGIGADACRYDMREPSWGVPPFAGRAVGHGWWRGVARAHDDRAGGHPPRPGLPSRTRTASVALAMGRGRRGRTYVSQREGGSEPGLQSRPTRDESANGRCPNGVTLDELSSAMAGGPGAAERCAAKTGSRTAARDGQPDARSPRALPQRGQSRPAIATPAAHAHRPIAECCIAPHSEPSQDVGDEFARSRSSSLTSPSKSCQPPAP
jgi:hypothetical protein